MPLPVELNRKIEQDLRARLVELVSQGVDVVLDLSFWSRRARLDYRALLRPLGIEPETIYLATAQAVVLERVASRSSGHDGDSTLPEDLAPTTSTTASRRPLTKAHSRSSAKSSTAGAATLHRAQAG